MGTQTEKRKAWMRFLTVLLLCSTMLVITFGTAYARYEKSAEQELALSFEGQENQMYITLAEAGEASLLAAEDVNTQVVEFVLSNGTSAEDYCTYDQMASLAVFATIGVENPENLMMTLYDGGAGYMASCSEISEGSAYYNMYGPGWIYRFYTEAGEEVSWHFPGIQRISRQMYITITGTSELPANLSFITSAKPGTIR